MIDFKFIPDSYFEDESSSVLLAKMNYPESQWGEQISIYAHWIERKIHFEAVDFYGNEYMIYPSKVEETLSQEDFIYLLEGLQINTDMQTGNMDLILDGIPEVSSHIYPGLSEYFAEKRKSIGLP